MDFSKSIENNKICQMKEVVEEIKYNQEKTIQIIKKS